MEQGTSSTEIMAANGVNLENGATVTRKVDPETGVITEEHYRLNGLHHRNEEDGPAVIYRNKFTGQVSEVVYYDRGMIHREDGPAKIHWNADGGEVDTATCYRFGSIHRNPAEGPALIVRSPIATVATYFVNGRVYRDPVAGPSVVLVRQPDGVTFPTLSAPNARRPATRALQARRGLEGAVMSFALAWLSAAVALAA